MIEPLTLPGTLDSLDDIRKYVTEAAVSAGVEKKATYRLCLAVDEIATNSIIHGYEEQGLQGSLYIWAEVDETQLRILVEDEGKMYDPHQAAQPTDLEDSPENRKIGGLGIYLTLKGVDEFKYEWVNNHNRNIFIVRRSQGINPARLAS